MYDSLTTSQTSFIFLTANLSTAGEFSNIFNTGEHGRSNYYILKNVLYKYICRNTESAFLTTVKQSHEAEVEEICVDACANESRCWLHFNLDGPLPVPLNVPFTHRQISHEQTFNSVT